MSIMRMRERFNRFLFNAAVPAIDQTPAVGPGSRNFIALSMVQKRDVLPYLLAVKSFSVRLRPSRVVVVADPSLDAGCRATIRAHIPHVEIRDAAEFRRDGLPVGGTWERLSAISQFSRDHYVIQLDADTVTLGPLQEVESAIGASRAFTLGTEDDQSIVTCEEISAWAGPLVTEGCHVQLVAESLLARLPDAASLRYARGCSGFAGFPAGSLPPDKLIAFSRGMSMLLKDRWSQWGTEQFASNTMIASQPGAMLLPHPTYCAPHRRTDATVFLHFIGYVRYASSLYARLARQVSRDLRAAA